MFENYVLVFHSVSYFTFQVDQMVYIRSVCGKDPFSPQMLPLLGPKPPGTVVSTFKNHQKML